jgi:hypothetical protein
MRMFYQALASDTPRRKLTSCFDHEADRALGERICCSATPRLAHAVTLGLPRRGFLDAPVDVDAGLESDSGHGIPALPSSSTQTNQGLFNDAAVIQAKRGSLGAILCSEIDYMTRGTGLRKSDHDEIVNEKNCSRMADFGGSMLVDRDTGCGPRRAAM